MNDALNIPNREPDYKSPWGCKYWFDEMVRCSDDEVPCYLQELSGKLHYASPMGHVNMIRKPEIQSAYKNWLINIKIDKILLDI